MEKIAADFYALRSSAFYHAVSGDDYARNIEKGHVYFSPRRGVGRRRFCG